MAAKLSDSEFAARARASAKRRAERQRLRKAATGKVQVNQWLPATAKARLDALSAALNTSPSEVMTAAIMAFKPVGEVEPPAAPDPSPPMGDPTEPDPVVTKSGADPPLIEIARLVAEGKSWQQVADDLNARGFHTATGAQFHKGALHRLWAKQQEAQP